MDTDISLHKEIQKNDEIVPDDSDLETEKARPARSTMVEEDDDDEDNDGGASFELFGGRSRSESESSDIENGGTKKQSKLKEENGLTAFVPKKDLETNKESKEDNGLADSTPREDAETNKEDDGLTSSAVFEPNKGMTFFREVKRKENDPDELTSVDAHPETATIKRSSSPTPSTSFHDSNNGKGSISIGAADDNCDGSGRPPSPTPMSVLEENLASATITNGSQEPMLDQDQTANVASSKPKFKKGPPTTPDETWDFSLQALCPNYKSKCIWLEGPLFQAISNECLHEMHNVVCACKEQKKMPICRLCSQPFCSTTCFKSALKKKTGKTEDEGEPLQNVASSSINPQTEQQNSDSQPELSLRSTETTTSDPSHTDLNGRQTRINKKQDRQSKKHSRMHSNNDDRKHGSHQMPNSGPSMPMQPGRYSVQPQHWPSAQFNGTYPRPPPGHSLLGSPPTAPVTHGSLGRSVPFYPSSVEMRMASLRHQLPMNISGSSINSPRNTNPSMHMPLRPRFGTEQNVQDCDNAKYDQSEKSSRDSPVKILRNPGAVGMPIGEGQEHQHGYQQQFHMSDSPFNACDSGPGNFSNGDHERFKSDHLRQDAAYQGRTQEDQPQRPNHKQKYDRHNKGQRSFCQEVQSDTENQRSQHYKQSQRSGQDGLHMSAFSTEQRDRMNFGTNSQSRNADATDSANPTFRNQQQPPFNRYKNGANFMSKSLDGNRSKEYHGYSSEGPSDRNRMHFGSENMRQQTGPNQIPFSVERNIYGGRGRGHFEKGLNSRQSSTFGSVRTNATLSCPLQSLKYDIPYGIPMEVKYIRGNGFYGFSVMTLKNYHTFQDFHKDLQTQNIVKLLEMYEIGDICVIKHPSADTPGAPDEWYRGMITKVVGNIGVYLLDLGVTTLVSSVSIYVLPEKYVQYKPFAIRFRCLNLKIEEDGEFKSDICEYFQDLVCSQNVKVRITHKDCDEKEMFCGHLELQHINKWFDAGVLFQKFSIGEPRPEGDTDIIQEINEGRITPIKGSNPDDCDIVLPATHNSKLSAFISWVKDINEFYITTSELLLQKNKLEDYLNGRNFSNNCKSVKTLEDLAYPLHMFQDEQKRWVRVKVLEVSSGVEDTLVLVKKVDLGETLTLKLEKLKQLPADCCGSCCVFKCSLPVVVISQGRTKFSKEILSYLNSIAESKIKLEVSVFMTDKSVHIVELFMPSSKTGCAKTFLDKKWVKLSHPIELN